MKPVLYKANETDFTHCGLGVLNDCITCDVYEELDGEFELTITYPVNGVLFEELAVDKIVVAKPSQRRGNQAFRIYDIKKSSRKAVTVKAEHVSYQLNHIVLKPLYASNLGNALERLNSFSVSENPFSFDTDMDKSKVKAFSIGHPVSARLAMIDEDNSIKSAWGGEWEYDNYTATFKQRRGEDNGFRIAYAKNMTGITCEESVEGVVTGCIAYYQGTDEEGDPVTVVGQMQRVEHPFGYSHDIAYDASYEFDVAPAEYLLDISAQEQLDKADKEPYLIVKVDFVNLGDSEEYKQFRDLETVDIGDTVGIYHPLYKIDISARVIATKYNVLLERYSSVDVGRRKVNISDTLSGILAKLY